MMMKVEKLQGNLVWLRLADTITKPPSYSHPT